MATEKKDGTFEAAGVIEQAAEAGRAYVEATSAAAIAGVKAGFELQAASLRLAETSAKLALKAFDTK